VLPLVTVALSGFMFGWAKPVPVNFHNLRNPRWHSIWVAAAGPGVNVLQALIWALVARILAETVSPTGLAGGFWLAVAEKGVIVNVIFAILNLFPLLPLDGGRIMASLLPPKLSYTYSRLEPFGLIILLVLVATGALSRVLGPMVMASVNQIYSMFGLQ
jgi:Zn-dependent protease